MPTAETHFIPFMVNRFGMEPGLENRSRMDEFYRLLTRTAFFLEMESMGISLARKELDEIDDRSSWAAVLEFLLRRYAPQSASGADHLFGDKTPGYLLHLPLLKTIFPKARFLHIIRDPRDYALSVRKAWGKSIYRAADNWVRCIDRCREDAQPLDGDYLEIRFESLLEEPETTLRSVCGFIDCVFSSEMLTLERPAENLGDAKDEVAILRTNQEKIQGSVQYQGDPAHRGDRVPAYAHLFLPCVGGSRPTLPRSLVETMRQGVGRVLLRTFSCPGQRAGGGGALFCAPSPEGQLAQLMSMSRTITRNGLAQRETKGAMGADSQAKRIHVIFTGTDPETNSGGIGVVLKGYFRALEIAEIPFSSVPTYHPRQFGGKTLKFFFALPRLAAAILSGQWQGRIPVVYSHAGAGVSLLRESVVLLFSRSFGARTVLHIHAPAIDGYLNSVVKRGLLKLCLSIPGMVVVLTPWWKDRLQSAGIGSPIRVVANPLLPELELVALEQGPRQGSRTRKGA
jgi:hypothetical protein